LETWSVITRGAEETRSLGCRLGELAPAGLVVLLDGDLGAGKTCFAQGVARGLGVPPQMPVTSPSYALMNVYQGRLTLYHFDLYRLSRVEDLDDLGYDDCAENDGVTLVEWADRISDPPPASLRVSIQQAAEEERRFVITASDAVGRGLLVELSRQG